MKKGRILRIKHFIIIIIIYLLFIKIGMLSNKVYAKNKTDNKLNTHSYSSIKEISRVNNYLKPMEINVEGSKNVAKGKKIKLKAYVSPINANQKVFFFSHDSNIATVNSKGIITGKKVGSVKITIKSAIAGTVKETFRIRVMAKAVKKVRIKGKKKIELDGENKTKLVARATPSKAAQNFIWKSSNTKIAKVNSKGVVTAMRMGKVKISAIATDGSKKKAVVTIKVVKNIKSEDIKIKNIEIINTPEYMIVDEMATLHVNALPKNASNQNISWHSSNQEVIEVNKDGILKAKKYGTAIITATAQDGSGITVNTQPIHIYNKLNHEFYSTAHQGFRNNGKNIPNTKEAIIDAAKHGFDICQFNVHFTKDGVCVLHHDKYIYVNDEKQQIITSESTGRKLYFSDYSYDEIMKYSYKNGAKIPSLDEALLDCKTYGIKPYILSDDMTKEEVETVVGLVKKHSLEDEVIFAGVYSRKVLSYLPDANISVVLWRIVDVHDVFVSQEGECHWAYEHLKQGHVVWVNMPISAYTTTETENIAFISNIRAVGLKALVGIFHIDSTEDYMTYAPFADSIMSNKYMAADIYSK